MQVCMLVLGIMLSGMFVIGTSARTVPEHQVQPPFVDISKQDFETRPLDYPYIAGGTVRYHDETISWLLHFDAPKRQLSVMFDIDLNPDELRELIPRSAGFARSASYHPYETGVHTLLYPTQTVCTMEEINHVSCDFRKLTEAISRSLTDVGLFTEVKVRRMTPLP